MEYIILHTFLIVIGIIGIIWTLIYDKRKKQVKHN